MKNKRWKTFSAAEPSERTAYIKLNRQTAGPPRTAVPVNQRGGVGSFTRNTQFAFGHGGDPASYVKVEPNHFRLVGNGGIALAKIGARWKLAEPIGMQQAINPWKGLLLAMRKSFTLRSL